MTPFDIKIPTTLYQDKDPMKIQSLIPEFTQYILDQYAEGVVRELSKDPRYNKSWVSKSKEFKVYMESLGYPGELHFTTDDIKGFFSIKKYPKYVLIEVSRRARLGKRSLERYLRLVEFGTSRFPARYLFTPVRRDLELNMRYYWDTFFETHVESVPSSRKPTHYEMYLEQRRGRRA